MPDPISLPDLSQEPTIPTQTINSGAINRFEQFGRGVEDAFDQTGAVMDPFKWAMETVNPGPTIPQDQLPQNLKDAYPQGVGKNVLSILENEKQHNAYVNQQLSYAPQGFLTDVSRFTSGVIGTMIAPQNIATTLLAPELLPEKLIPDIALSTKRMSFITHGIRGAALGEGINTAVNLNNYYYESELGNNPTPGSIFNGYKLAGIGGFLGGALYGLSGKAQRIGQASDNSNTLNTAVAQSVNDKPVDVGPQIQQSLYETAQKMREDGFDDDLSKATSQSTQDQIDSINEELSKGKDSDSISNQLGLGKLNTLNDNLYNHENLNAEQQNFNDNIQSIPYFKKLSDISKKHPLLRSEDDSEFLDKFINNQSFESELLRNDRQENNKNLQIVKQKINEINDNIKNSKGIEEKSFAATDLRDYEEKLNDLQQTKKQIDIRSKQIKSLKDIDSDTRSKALNREKLKFKRLDYQNIKDHIDAQSQVYRVDAQPVENIIKSKERMADPNNDVAFDKNGQRENVDAEVPEGRPSEPSNSFIDDADLSDEELENKILELSKKGLISKENFDKEMDELLSDKEDANNAKSLWDKFTQCLLGATANE